MMMSKQENEVEGCLMRLSKLTYIRTEDCIVKKHIYPSLQQPNYVSCSSSITDDYPMSPFPIDYEDLSEQVEGIEDEERESGLDSSYPVI
jgi:hypothetical protein